MRRVFVWLVTTMAVVCVPTRVTAEDSVDARIQALERRIAQQESPVRDNSSDGAVVILYGVLCALWAQNTGRNAWLWFFMGMVFSVITVMVLLYKNSEDRKRGRDLAELPGG
jgi:hypothetical protein